MWTFYSLQIGFGEGAFIADLSLLWLFFFSSSWFGGIMAELSSRNSTDLLCYWLLPIEVFLS